LESKVVDIGNCCTQFFLLVYRTKNRVGYARNRHIDLFNLRLRGAFRFSSAIYRTISYLVVICIIVYIAICIVIFKVRIIWYGFLWLRGCGLYVFVVSVL